MPSIDCPETGAGQLITGIEDGGAGDVGDPHPAVNAAPSNSAKLHFLFKADSDLASQPSHVGGRRVDLGRTEHHRGLDRYG